PSRMVGLRDVWVGSESDIVVVGDVDSVGGSVPREVGLFAWNGVEWTRHLSVPGSLEAITGLGGGDLVAVGEDGLVAQRRSGVWSTTTVPGQAPPDLSALWVGSGEVITVGRTGAIFRYSITNGSWTTSVLPVAGFLAIAGRSTSDLYASSYSSLAAPSIDQLWHYDGRAWFPLEVDASVGKITSLQRGPQGDVVGPGANFTTYRFAPGGWGVQAVSNLVVFEEPAVFITGAGDTAYAVVSPYLYRYRETEAAVVGIAGVDPTAMHALSEDELYLGEGGSLKLFNGVTDTVTELPQRCPVSACTSLFGIIGLWAQAPGHVHFISYTDNPSDDRTILYERTPDAIRTERAQLQSSSDRFVAVSGAGSTAYALTREGWLWSNRTGSWEPWLQLALSGVSLWVHPDGTIFVGGDDGVIWRYALGLWAPLATETRERINSIHGSSSTNGAGSPDDVFATTQTTVQHFDGIRWSPVRAHSDGVGSVWTTDRNAYFVKRGSFRRLQRPTAW
ncbi:MAG: hypothetical protein ACKV2T_08370, partial [Kofleriaceae bacterium]